MRCSTVSGLLLAALPAAVRGVCMGVAAVEGVVLDGLVVDGVAVDGDVVCAEAASGMASMVALNSAATAIARGPTRCGVIAESANRLV
jgi:hypothetical protein